MSATERDPASSRHSDPYVPADQELSELTLRALLIGVLMAVVLGAANAYLGMKAGLTVAATFPAAVVAMAALRPFKGSILEENLARTTASVGEALVAGAIFTIPAFVISGVWDGLRYWESTLIMLIGGLLGVLFVIVLRRTLVVEAELPFPESVAAGELVKAGQGGQTGARYVFAAMGLAGGWELLKNSNGIQVVSDYARGFVSLGTSQITLMGQTVRYQGGVMLESAAASPALVGVGFIVGPQIAAVLFSGALTGWLLLVPLESFSESGAQWSRHRLLLLDRSQHRSVAPASPSAGGGHHDRGRLLYSFQAPHVPHQRHQESGGRLAGPQGGPAQREPA